MENSVGANTQPCSLQIKNHFNCSWDPLFFPLSYRVPMVNKQNKEIIQILISLMVGECRGTTV